MKKIIAIATIAAFVLSASTASAWHWSSSDITVNNNNGAYVKNNVTTVADTGSNVAIGGSVSNKVEGDDNINNDANGGGGNAAVTTGAASAGSMVENYVNKNTTKVNADCGCKGDVEVNNYNRAKVKNNVLTSADSGYNQAFGGDVKNKVKGDDNENNDADGSGGAASVKTGSADAGTSVVNVVNKNLTRV